MVPILLDGRFAPRLCGLAVGLSCLAGSVLGQDNPAAPALPADVVATTWEWTELQTPKEAITVPEPGNYTLTFAEDGAVALQVDCNRGVSSYTISPDNRIAFDPIATTMMMCDEGSLDHTFTSNLERVSSFFQLEGDLLLEQPYDSGTLRFRPAATEELSEAATRP